MKTLVKGIYSRSIGLGGDSTISISNNKLKIGPERKDKPAALNGKYPTVTDALISLGLLHFGEKDLAIKSISSLSKNFNLNHEEFSRKVL